jgi:trigger factor
MYDAAWTTGIRSAPPSVLPLGLHLSVAPPSICGDSDSPDSDPTMSFEIAVKKAEGVERLLGVTVPLETVRAAEDKATKRYASAARMPGFRPGKAPIHLVKKAYAEQIRSEAIESLVQDAWKQALDQESLEPIAQPHVHDLKFEDGEPLTFDIHLEVRPTIAIETTTGFVVARPSEAVTDTMIDEQLETLREQRGALMPVEDKPQPGDQVKVKIASQEEGADMPEQREYPLELGKGQAIPGIEELIMEATPGETVERPVRWPDDFPDEAQRGKSKLTRVSLLEVKRKQLPSLDDAFARELGDFETVSALKDAIRKDMGEHVKREADSAVREQLLDQVIAANPFEIPNAWVQQVMGAYMQMYQVPDGMQERFAGEFRPMAERQVRRDVVIDTIAEREGLVASTADVDDKVAQMAAERSVETAQLYVQLEKGGRLKELERGVTDEKVFNWLIARNTVNQVA